MELRGRLGFKGERGYSAYEIAVKNGFVGTEQDWLATLGTSQKAAKNFVEYVTMQDNETELVLPDEYIPNISMVDIYIEGKKVSYDRYSINYENKKITLLDAIPNSGKKVEIIIFTFLSNNLPIVETIDENSTNDTTPGTKKVYDFVEEVKTNISNNIKNGTGEFTNLIHFSQIEEWEE